VIYLDSSAILKLVRREAETATLVDWLSDRIDEGLCTSLIADVEVVQATRRLVDAPRALPVALARLAEVDKIILDHSVVAVAQSLEGLRSLDAIHLASALSLGDTELIVVTYDSRLRDACDRYGVAVAAPGHDLAN